MIYLHTSDVPHTFGKLSTRATNFLHTSLQLEVCTKHYGPPNSGILRLSTWKSRDKMTFGCKHKEYYKGEGGDFPQVKAMVIIVHLCLSMVNPCIKNVLTMH